ncbi:Recombination protein MgsA [Desulfocicer vacuolatum DSM 3385]|uniref:Replication-associated recombination protein A n=1 Tax=Desulfocicer vacuolatum DSM 3385 TaxID=1121400 RepID=A0A1W1YJC2_9BACT|nr:replication-associated recombination protein A [Desulfocicer vacuolatum]SMC36267.1 Recombination protein MgsA [Desulfocicer vacuolatum DSM 3385]
MDLFDAGMAEQLSHAPLADRMRPRHLEEVVGQAHVVGRDSLLCRSIADDRLFSIILWGPPGCGKTTIAGIIARETRSHFMEISAVLSGVKEIRKVIDAAGEQRRLHARRTILFVDEIHRFNKAQQDAFLHHVEKGLIILVGATTENPSFEVIPALVSRCRVVALKRLSKKQIRLILERALTDRERGLGHMNLTMSGEALDHIAAVSDGDVRIALTNLEAAAGFARQSTPDVKSGSTGAPMDVTLADVEQAVQKKALRYDKSGDQHFNLISAFHKSLRGSDPDAALYWMTRMMSAGEDPLYILRRMVRFAVEDVGLADPGALTVALNALEAFRFLGHPEGDDCLAQAAIYLATAPKSNRVYMAGKAVRREVENTGYLPVPLHIRNAPTEVMKQQGYHAGYKYAHDYPGGYVPQEYLPRELDGCSFYDPTARGYEATVKNRLEARQRIHRHDAGREKK